MTSLKDSEYEERVLIYMCVSLDPIQQTVLTEIHIMQRNIVYNCSGWGELMSQILIIGPFHRIQSP